MLRFCLILALILAGHTPTPKPAPAATPTSPATASSVSIAAATNLIYVLEALNPAFRAVAPDITVTTALGASGTFVAQIKNGAPYDVFLSADLDYPRALITAGQAEARTLTPFANERAREGAAALRIHAPSDAVRRLLTISGVTAVIIEADELPAP